jgi:PAS domain S-box-containing protein
MAELEGKGEWKGVLKHTAKNGRELFVESRQQTSEIGGRRVVLETNCDITGTRQAELDSRFINDLDLAIAKITSADEIIRLATHALAEHLDVDRCHLSEINLQTGLSIIREPWQSLLSGAPSVAGVYRIGDHLSPEFLAGLERGQAVIINDVAIDPRTRDFAAHYKSVGVGAVICVPAMTEGRWEATLTVAQRQPRIWRPGEEQLLRDTAVRVCLAVEHSRSMAILRESEARARRTLVEQMVAGVAEADAAGNFKMVNQRYCEMTGRTKAELSQLRVSDVTHPEDWPSNAALYRRLFETGESFFIEKRYLRKDGSEIWVNTHTSPIRNADGRIEEAVAVVVDVTGRKHAEEGLRAACERAEAATRAKDEFLSLVSHELRTPLVSILGYTQLLRHPNPDAALIRRTVEVVEKNSKIQLQLIEDLLDTTRIISGKLKLEVRPVDVSEVINAAMEVVEPTAQAKRIELRATLAALAVQITGDPERLQQTVWNLLSNAIKFTPKGGLVEVIVTRTDPYVEIVVRDTGKGIDPEFLPYVFDRFRQADMSSRRRAGGLGLGLALVKHIVELHGGNVEAASGGTDQGATFTVRLPVRAVYTPPDAKNDDTQCRLGPHSLAGVHALIVDDEQDVRNLLKLTLENYGATVQAASSGKEALELLARQSPNEHFQILICDIAMPDEDGYAVIRKVRALPAEKGGALPAIALTAFGRSEYRSRALEAGFQERAVKPVKPEELVGLIQVMIK